MRPLARTLVAMTTAAVLLAACNSPMVGKGAVSRSAGSTAVSTSAGSTAVATSAGSTAVATSVGSTAVATSAGSTAVAAPPTGVLTVPQSGADAQPGATATARPGLPETLSGTPDGAIGNVGIGDPYYPASGNGGYEVDGYDIDLHYDPATNALAATTTLTATVTETVRLGRFDLDLQPTMAVSSVLVNGRNAEFVHRAAELVIDPATGLEPGAAFTVVVSYAGRPGLIPNGAEDLGDGGWLRTTSGGAIAIGEPFSASAWYPVNEHPSDPASYRVTATVPQKWSVISNGVASTAGLPTPAAGMKVFRWVQQHPITSYEATVYIDTFSTVTDITADGKPIVSVFAPSGDVAKYKRLAADTRRIVEVLSNHFGPYPFAAAGGIYTGQSLGFALETATRPVYPVGVDTPTIVHELTHQWFGDDVVIKRWADICLNECFASYGPWLWDQDVNDVNLDTQWEDQMSVFTTDTAFWRSPLVDMGAGKEFTSVYTRGPLAIHALRKQMGEKDFAALLRDWPATYDEKAASWSDFVAYANKISGQDLTAFINAWFRGTTPPAAQFLHPGGLGS